jgi:hypothetical protein
MYVFSYADCVLFVCLFSLLPGIGFAQEHNAPSMENAGAGHHRWDPYLQRTNRISPHLPLLARYWWSPPAVLTSC